ncbi:type VI secretion system-associated FHA domain protein TagH [Variovorax sp. OV329]|uniref:type VI secretion system-associated FHA domain protein TagH n=1 Tax=Variovorax sp. OV329 TaxID=1882825 RepID=UPI0008E42F81|nr:type VI secretion system-associated FHA domain protein TagH [Variovorax sp. OV329]SFM63362.1 FHA domain protein [Variovorax sp. OV329]
MIALRITRRPGATEPDETALPMPPEGLTIGRAADCTVVLSDPLRLVSRRHAEVFASGTDVRVRCISGSAPLWVNGMQMDPGGEGVLLVGDRLRIGGFELAVEPVAATAMRRSRLDRWFDLEGVPDPLAEQSPLPALAHAHEAEEASAVVSWQTSLHVVRTGAPVAPIAPVAPVAPSAPSAPSAPLVAPAPPRAQSEVPTVPLVRPKPSTVASTTSTAPLAPQLQELAAAFGRGARLGADVAPLTPEGMEHLGALLRATAEGTLALLQSRAVAKRQMRAEGTHINPRQNNPLKFSPDATEALTRMLQREPSPGFLDPVAALKDAHHDLLVHQVAMVAGMRAAVFELFSRLGPEAAENAEGPAYGAARLPLLRAVALWNRHRMQHAQLLEHLDDDFEAIFGREFLRAYEAQSRADPDPASPEAQWPTVR